MQDNALPHVAHGTVAFLDQHDVEVMDWPAMSPGFNPIEIVWEQMSIWIGLGLGLGIQHMDNPPSNLAELRQAIRQACEQFRREG